MEEPLGPEGVALTAAVSAPAISPEVFWAEISPCEHLLQLYEDDRAFLEPLCAFVAGGIQCQEAIVVIATAPHLVSLELQLGDLGLDVEAARNRNQFTTIEAEAMLRRFMVNGWPDEELFRTSITAVIDHAKRDFPRVRAFGEMVALLWAQGRTAATVRLEHLWHELHRQESFTLFCSYPKVGFTSSPQESLEEIYRHHSKLLHYTLTDTLIS